LGAEQLATCVDQGFSCCDNPDHAIARFGELRDAAAQEVIDLFTAMQNSPADIEAYFGIFASTVSPAQFFAPENLHHIIKQKEVA
jgi:hypothetical protein